MVATQSRSRNRSKPAEAALTSQRFVLQTDAGSILHRLVGYEDQGWGRILVVYFIVVAVTYGVMAFATQAYPHPNPTLPLLRDWAVAFALWISLPAILFFIASDQYELARAMRWVEAAGVATASEQQAKDFSAKWTARFKKINISLQAAAVLLAVLFSCVTYFKFWVDLIDPGRKAPIPPTWQLASLPNAYAYMWGIGVFYAVLIIYIGRGLAMVGLLKNLADTWKIKLSPLHPDGCGGLRPVGRIGLRHQYALTILGINIAVVALTISKIKAPLVPSIIGPALAIYLIFGPIIFIGPLLPFRGLMLERRRALMQEIAEPLDAQFDKVKAEARTTRDIAQKDFDVLERLRAFGKTVGELPVWPFDPRTKRVFVTAYVTPIVVAVGGKLVEAILGLAN